MDAEIVKYVVIGIVAFVAFGVVPIVLALLSHQEKMSALFAKHSLDSHELTARIESLEKRLANSTPVLNSTEGGTPVGKV